MIAFGRDAAIKELRSYLSLCGMVFGDPEYDWSKAAAIEFANLYIEETGENFGSNQ